MALASTPMASGSTEQASAPRQPHLLSTGEVYRDLGEDYFTNRRDPERRARRLVARTGRPRRRRWR